MASKSVRERQKVMRTALRRMALEVDPEHARFAVLARELDVELHTVLRWITVGKTTHNRASALNRRFGDVLANIETLTGGSPR